LLILSLGENILVSLSKEEERAGAMLIGIETPWRKKPEYQGGFLLDGGVHFIAAALTAYTTLLQEHLPPVDTVDSVWRTKSGISGTFSVSFGTTLSGSEYTVACEKGSVTITWVKGRSQVIVRLGEASEGNTSETEFANEGSGVKVEVAAWAESIADGTPNPAQSPEQALADLEILEKMLKSGEGGGKVQSLQYQI
jgi:predicted dehydrogenase